jgi:spore coat polysaccharide biosynthesis protein SpsF (cytidylyltransferase family)
MKRLPLDGEPRVVGIVSARMASTRYPGKAMVPLAGRPLIEVLLQRIASVPVLDSVALATSSNPENEPLVQTRTTCYAGTWTARIICARITSCA